MDACAREATFLGYAAACMAPEVVRSKDGSRGLMKGSDRDFHVLETDEYVALASSLVAGVRLFTKAYLFVPRVSARRAAWDITAWAVRSAI